MDTLDLFKALTFGTKISIKQLLRNTERSKALRKMNDKIKIKDESDDAKLMKPIKRKFEDIEEEIKEEENESSFPIMSGIQVSTNGMKKTKKQKKELTEEKIKLFEQEKINQFKNAHGISTTGKKIPKPFDNFAELCDNYRINTDLYKNLKKCGYITPTPIQMQAIPLMLENRQVLACAPTGSGKTAAFLFPIIHHLEGPQKKGFRAVILNPTRELAKQTYREVLRLSEGRDFRVHIISKVNQALEKYGPNSSQKFDILITTPKRLEFLLTQDPPAISLNNVEWLVVDEADKLFERTTRSFREQLKEILTHCTNPKLKRVMFSATSTPAVTKWCRRNMKELATVNVGHRNAAVDSVKQELLFAGDESGKLLAIRNIIQKGLAPPVLIFVQSKERAQALFSELMYDGIMVDVIHADRTQTQRDNVVQCFREGKIWILVCTDVMARGIDFKGVNLVINYDFPSSAISYIHRIGRTGRAGHKGKAITFFTLKDTDNLRSIASVMRSSGCEVPDYMLHLKKPNKLEQKLKIRESIKNKSKESATNLKTKKTIDNKRIDPSRILKKNDIKEKKTVKNSNKRIQTSKKIKKTQTNKKTKE